MKIRKYAFLTAFFSLLFLACGQHDIVEKETTYYEFSSSSNQQAGSSSSLSSSSNQMQETSSSSVDSSVDDCDFIINLRIDTECFYDETVKIPINRIPKSPIVLGSQARLKFADKASLQIMGYSLKIEPGAELSFGEDSELLVDAEGSLEISGEKESMVMLKADDYTKPWAGIRVRSDARSASIEYADLSGAKTGINFGKDGVLKNSKVHNNFEYGMRQNTPFLLGNFSNNEFYSNGRDALISLELAATLGAPEQFSGRLHISGGGDVPANAVLPGFAYDVEGAITVMGKLKIMPGAHFYFTESSHISIARGDVEAIGTSDKPIIFESASSDIFWDGIKFSNNCENSNVFEYFEVLNAKTAFYNDGACNVTLPDGKVTYRDKAFDKGPALSTPSFIEDENVINVISQKLQ